MGFLKAPALRRSSLAYCLLALIPILSYVALVFHFSVNIPLLDDYDTVLAYLNTPGSLRYQALFEQHNEHRVVWTRLVAEVFYDLFGQIDFRHLIYFGNLAFLLLCALLLKLFNSQKNPVILFVPIPYLLFQPQAWENMTWATGALQNYFVLFFALLAFYFWNRATWLGYFLASSFAVMAVFTSANGLLVLFILFFGEARSFIAEKITNAAFVKSPMTAKHSRLLVILMVLLFITCLAYFKNYHGVEQHPSVLGALLQPVQLIQYVLLLLGSCMGFTKSLAFLTGFVEIIIFIYITYSGYYQKNPIIYYFLLFIFLTVLVIALGRTGFGIEQAFAPRYKVLSSLSLVLIYWALMERCPEIASIKSVMLFLVFFAMAFNIVSTLIYVANLAKCQELLKGITVWEKTGAGLYYPNQQVASLTLKHSIKKGVYKIPTL